MKTVYPLQPGGNTGQAQLERKTVMAVQAGPAGKPPPLALPPLSETVRFHQLLSALKLPNDRLSRNLLSFARHFSLPLESETLNAMRREALGQKRRDAAALGLAAAGDKGLALTGRALKEYAAAIEPWNEAADKYGREGGQNEFTGDGRQESAGGRDSGTEDKHGKKPPSAGRLKAIIKKNSIGILEKQPALDFINRIPGKNGRWIVLPFSFSGGGLDVQVSLRVLLDDRDNTVRRFAADIAAERRADGTERRWFFMLDGQEQKLEFAVDPPARSEGNLIRELAGIFGVSQDKIIQRNNLPPFPDLGNDLLRSVDEQV